MVIFPLQVISHSLPGIVGHVITPTAQYKLFQHLAYYNQIVLILLCALIHKFRVFCIVKGYLCFSLPCQTLRLRSLTKLPAKQHQGANVFTRGFSAGASHREKKTTCQIKTTSLNVGEKKPDKQSVQCQCHLTCNAGALHSDKRARPQIDT